MKSIVIAALILAASPAHADEFMVTALDRCLPGLYRGTLEGKRGGGCARYLLLRCDSRPDPIRCGMSMNRAVSARIVDLASSPGAPPAPEVPPGNGFDCRSVFSESYCRVWDEGGRLDALVIDAARQGIALDFSPAAAVADDLSFPLREFDRCLDRAAASADARGERATPGPEGLICAEFLSTECRIMAKPDACTATVSATLGERITKAGPLQPPRYRVLPDQRSNKSPEEVALLNLALHVVELRLTFPFTGVSGSDSP